ncbi:MAG: cytochrome c-type biogenesis protein [Ferrimonas sp.]
MIRILGVLWLTCCAMVSIAAPIDTFEFSNDALRDRAQGLAAELRCPQCQNQNLHDSNSPIAMDMRLQVYQMVEEGRSNQEIVTYFTDRYGDFVRYRPAFDGRTVVLWLGPLVFLLLGVAAGGLLIRRQRTAVEQLPELSSEEQAKLHDLLKK